MLRQRSQNATMESVKALSNLLCKLKVWTDCRGQDLVEYALAAGMIAAAGVAAMPILCGTLSVVYSKIGSAIMATVQ